MMGCDIHFVFQINTPYGWVPVRCKSDPLDHLDRDYKTFAVMADVRNEGYIYDILYPARGLPENLMIFHSSCSNEDGDYHTWMGDHSFSWLTLSELNNIKEHFSQEIKVTPYPWTLLKIIFELDIFRFSNNLSHDEVRIVFGFDN